MELLTDGCVIRNLKSGGIVYRENESLDLEIKKQEDGDNLDAVDYMLYFILSLILMGFKIN